MSLSIKAITLTAFVVGTSAVSTSCFAKTQQNSAYLQSTTITKQSRTELPTEEKIGISVGAILGGIFGGPPGAMITAIAGDFIAKHVIAEQEITELETDILAKQSLLNSTEKTHQEQLDLVEQKYQHEFQQEMVKLAASYEQSAAAQAENILVSLLFRTGSSDIEPHYQQQVIALARVLELSPQLKIDLSGYTDKQGQEALNNQLSQARVDSVKALLVKHGVDSNRIFSSAFGESSPIDTNNQSEVNYFDRRVVMKIKSNETEVATLN